MNIRRVILVTIGLILLIIGMFVPVLTVRQQAGGSFQGYSIYSVSCKLNAIRPSCFNQAVQKTEILETPYVIAVLCALCLFFMVRKQRPYPLLFAMLVFFYLGLSFFTDYGMRPALSGKMEIFQSSLGSSGIGVAFTQNITRKPAELRFGWIPLFLGSFLLVFSTVVHDKAEDHKPRESSTSESTRN